MNRRLLLVALVLGLLAALAVLLMQHDSVGHVPNKAVTATAPPVAALVPGIEAIAVRTVPVAESADVRLALVAFVSGLGTILPGAELSTVEAGMERKAGIANDEGKLSIDAATVEDKDCIARAEGHLPCLVRMPAKLEKTTIYLRPTASISGFVRLADGTPPKTPILVVAQQNRIPLLCEDIVSRKNICSATTDALGAFTITGLDADRQYALTGAGQGYMVDWSIPVVASGTSGIELKATPLYGFRLITIDAGDRAIQTAPELTSNGEFSVRFSEHKFKDASRYLNQVVLAGIQGVDCAEAERPDCLAFVYVSESETEQVGPIIVEVERPGYRRQTRIVWAKRIWQSITDETIRLEPITTASGTVEIGFLPTGLELDTEVVIRLKGTQNRPPLYVKVPRIPAKPYVVAGVPCDDYDCEVRGCDNLFKLSKLADGTPLRIRVLPDKVTALTVNLDGLSFLDLSFRDELGLTYVGPITVRIIDMPTRAVRHITYVRPPYFVVGLSPGAYSVSGIRGYSGATPVGEEEFRTQIEVQQIPLQGAILESKYQRRSTLR